MKIEVLNLSDISTFFKLHKHFEELTLNYMNDIDYANTSLSLFNTGLYRRNSLELVAEFRKSDLAVLKSKQLTIWDDYKELAELCVLFLKDEGLENKTALFKRQETLHEVRWRAKLLENKIKNFEQNNKNLPNKRIRWFC